MCCKTDGGVVDLLGKIRIRPNKFDPIVLPELKYIIFNEADDILGLNYRSVCVDFEVEARGKSINEALDGLKNAIKHYIDLAIKDLERVAAYTELMEERRDRLSSNKVAYISYTQAEEHRFNRINEEIKHRIRLMSVPYYFDLLKRFFMARFVQIYMSRVEVL